MTHNPDTPPEPAAIGYWYQRVGGVWYLYRNGTVIWESHYVTDVIERARVLGVRPQWRGWQVARVS